jgi:monoamine oxidase
MGKGEAVHWLHPMQFMLAHEANQVMIIGAGIAGLIAARELAQHGVNVTLLEAHDRIGGRIRTERDSDGAICETGAEFVHGRPPELMAEIQRAQLLCAVTERRAYHFRGGKLFASGRQTDSTLPIFQAIENYRGRDLSFCDLLSRIDASVHAKQRALRYIEGFNAAKADRISVLALARQQRAEDAIAGDTIQHILSGYDSLPQAVLAQIDRKRLDLRLSTAITHVSWRPGEVIAHSADERFLANAAIITIPLSCLQQKTIAFDPPLRGMQGALAKLEMGHVVRITLHFRERFWRERAPGLGFLFDEDARENEFSVYWTGPDDHTPIITGWASGRRAEDLLAHSAEELTTMAIDSLAAMFALEPKELRKQLISAHYYDWARDPYSLGAYSYVLVGGTEAQRELAAPREKTLFFAGEHTADNGFHATVHGAVATGLRAAREVLLG